MEAQSGPADSVEFTIKESNFPLAWGATGPVGQTVRNRLKIGVRREGTVSNDHLETQSLTHTDG